MLVFIRLNPIPPPSLPVKLLSKLTPGLLYFKLCCIYSFEVSHSMQQFGITGFFAFPAGSCTARPKINFFSNPSQPHTPVHPKRIETLRQQHLSSLLVSFLAFSFGKKAPNNPAFHQIFPEFNEIQLPFSTIVFFGFLI